MTLSAEEFLALRPTVESVDIEGHGKVRIRGLSAEERDDYEQTLVERGPDGKVRTKRKYTNVRASLVMRCLVDENGERMFSDKDLGELGKVDGAIVDRLYDVARRLSGMSREAEEEAVEGFEPAQDDDSSSE